ncbi:flagellar protein FliS [Ascidiaceihabitans sp.]|nr:flagellar protein FliS [Ascidiaceihabitans sp.]
MNASVAINAYSTTKKQTISPQDVGYKVISSALHKLDTNLSILIFNQDSKEKVKAYEVSLLTIYFLQKSLDFNSGSDLAKNLFRLYEFCRITLLDKGISESQNDPDLKKCHSFISEIMESWDTVKPQ